MRRSGTRRLQLAVAVGTVLLVVIVAVAISQDRPSFQGREDPVEGTSITMVLQSGASDDEAAIFRRGLELEEGFLRETGRALTEPVEAWLAHGDPCVPSAQPGDGAAGWADAGWLCVDALVPIWRQHVRDDPSIATAVSAHELVHVWQEELGCASDEFIWLKEGIATDFAWRALVKGGLATEHTTEQAIREFGAFDREVEALHSYEDRGGDDPEYAMWHLAVRDLLRRGEQGPAAVSTFCEMVGEGVAWREAFASAFGLTIDDFYERFEASMSDYEAGIRPL